MSEPTAEQLPSPLAGVRVLDLSRAISGPYVGRLLSDLGAEVVKVEVPGTDITQSFGPSRHGHTGLYVQYNAGKRSVALDLTADGGPELLLQLAATCDVVIENFRPGTLDRLGVGPAVLSARNERLVLLSISGFGQWGPESGRQAYAPVVHAETGLLGRQAEVDGGEPRDVVLALADSVTALHGTVAVLAALQLRERTGTGQHLDISMFEAMLSSDDYVQYSLEGNPVQAATGQGFPTPDGPILISADPKFLWQRLRAHAGLRDAEPLPADKIAERAKTIRGWVASFDDRSALISELERIGVAWAEVRRPDTVLDSPTVIARQVVAQVDDRHGGTRPVIRTPYRFSAATCEPRGGAAHLGEHTDDVLARWLGTSPAEIARLRRSGVLGTDPNPATAAG